MTAEEFLNSEDCPNIKSGMALTQIQMYVIAGILEAYHLSKLNEITEKDIMDDFKEISDHTSYDYVKGAKDLRNKYLNNQ